MLQEITSEQLSEWIAFSRLEPFGFQAELYGSAIVSSTVHNRLRQKGKALMPEDFLPKEPAPRSNSAQEFYAGLKRFFGNKNDHKRARNKTQT